MAWATGLASRSMKRRGSTPLPPVHYVRAPWSPWSPASICPTVAASASRTRWWWQTRPPATHRNCSPGSPRNWPSCRRFTDRAKHCRFQKWTCTGDRRPAVADHRVPARQARQGPGVRAHQAQERALRQGRRQDLQRRREGGDRDGGPARHHLPLPRRLRLRVHGQPGLRAAPAAGVAGRRQRPASCSRGCRCRWPSTTAHRCTSSCR